jgi:hypothetical protein
MRRKGVLEIRKLETQRVVTAAPFIGPSLRWLVHKRPPWNASAAFNLSGLLRSTTLCLIMRKMRFFPQHNYSFLHLKSLHYLPVLLNIIQNEMNRFQTKKQE